MTQRFRNILGTIGILPLRRSHPPRLFEITCIRLGDVDAALHRSVIGIDLDQSRESAAEAPVAVVEDKKVTGSGQVGTEGRNLLASNPLDIVSSEYLLMPIDAGLTFVNGSGALA